jgi:phosphatidylglycerol---prolipoprotein diacylglyceryl transferase
MLPEIHLGPITLQTFGIAFALCFVSVGVTLAVRLRELGRPVDWAYEATFAALIGGLIGARLDFIIQNWSDVHGELLKNVFSGSGLIWFGGFVGGALGVCLWAWRRNYLGLELLDLGAVPLSVGYAVGRIGCQLSGDGDYGIHTSLPWGMSYPDGTVPTTDTVHPTPVYESVTMGLVAVVLWQLRDRVRPGALFALYLVLAGTERLLVEFIRRNEEIVAGLTQAQLISIAMIAAGGVWLFRMRRPLVPATA